MNKTLTVSKYLMRDNLKATLIYYGIILLLSVSMIFLSYLQYNSSREVPFGGFGFSALVFIFIVGLNSFKANFRFMQANNITRRRFIIASIISLMSIAALMAFIDAAMNGILAQVVAYDNVFAALHGSSSLIVNFIWCFALFSLAVSGGWLITIIYYVCNNFMKILVSIAPIIVIVLLGILDNMTGGIIGRGIKSFILAALGITSGNPFVAVFSFFVGTAIAFGLSYIIVRRVSLKG